MQSIQHPRYGQLSQLVGTEKMYNKIGIFLGKEATNLGTAKPQKMIGLYRPPALSVQTPTKIKKKLGCIIPNK